MKVQILAALLTLLSFGYANSTPIFNHATCVDPTGLVSVGIVSDLDADATYAAFYVRMNDRVVESSAVTISSVHADENYQIFHGEGVTITIANAANEDGTYVGGVYNEKTPELEVQPLICTLKLP